MKRFDVFVALSLLYFAAASFAETARRLGKPQLAPSFLLCTHPEFGPACEHICARAMRDLSGAEAGQLIAQINAAIEPINVAGLGNPERHNWYPVEADDILNAAAKLEASRDEVSALLKRCGFVREPIADRVATA
jgi:tetracycline 7-halogenase / FADH2 O2-dependent halogenase